MFEWGLAEADDPLRLTCFVYNVVFLRRPARRGLCVEHAIRNDRVEVFLGRRTVAVSREMNDERGQVRSSMEDLFDLH